MIHVASYLLVSRYSFAGKCLQNDLAKKISKIHAMPVVLVAMPLQKVVANYITFLLY